MSVVAQVVAASVTPTPSPVVQVVQVIQAHAAAGPLIPASVTDLLNKFSTVLAPYVVVISAAIASGLQVLLNKFPWLSHDIAKVQDLRRVLLAAALPLLGTLVAGLATGQNTLQLAPWVFLVAQILYAAVKAIQASGSPVLADAPLATDTPAVG